MAAYGTGPSGPDDSAAQTVSKNNLITGEHYSIEVQWSAADHLLISHSTDPYQNQALEYYCLQQLAAQLTAPLLLLYRNRPSVHLGRFQNPWLECRPAYLERQNIDLLRRLSGGGAVYHDQHNLNLCMIWPQAVLQQLTHAEQRRYALLNAVKNCTQRRFPTSPLDIGDKYDLLLHRTKSKVSGSAFRETRQAHMHHLTLLLGANLDQLVGALTPALSKQQISSKARDSRRAQVQNICSAGDWCWEQEALAFGINIQREVNLQGGGSGDVILPWSSISDGGQAGPSTISIPVHPCRQWEHIIGGTPVFEFLGFPVQYQVLAGVLDRQHYHKLRHDALQQPALGQILDELVYAGINSIKVE